MFKAFGGKICNFDLFQNSIIETGYNLLRGYLYIVNKVLTLDFWDLPIV